MQSLEKIKKKKGRGKGVLRTFTECGCMPGSPTCPEGLRQPQAQTSRGDPGAPGSQLLPRSTARKPRNLPNSTRNWRRATSPAQPEGLGKPPGPSTAPPGPPLPSSSTPGGSLPSCGTERGQLRCGFSPPPKKQNKTIIMITIIIMVMTIMVMITMMIKGKKQAPSPDAV